MLDGRFNKVIILILSLNIFVSDSCCLMADDKTDRIRERRIQLLEERAIQRIAYRAQQKAQARAQLKAERIENQSERLVSRFTEEQLLSSENISTRAEMLVQQVRLMKGDTEKRRRSINALRQEYSITVINQQGREMIVRQGEIIALNISPKGLAAAKKLKMIQNRAYQLNSINSRVNVFTLDDGADLFKIKQQLVVADPDGYYEFNQVYKVASAENENASILVNPEPSFTEDNFEGKTEFTIGLIDTGVNVNHNSLQNSTLEQQNFGRGKTITPRNHGTAISSIIARHGRAKVYVADVFSGSAGYGDTEAIIKALNWLAEANVGVINMSLTGPDNFILQHAVSTLTDKGHIIVAAVGNEGPTGPLRYPAAYKQVVAVTAVDENLQIYKKANQGTFVDIAASGVDILASSTRGQKSYSGTSFAAPFVSAVLAPRHQFADRKNAVAIIKDTLASLVDLGEEGYDPIFGYGLLDSHNYNEESKD
jgi:hypothetical protein